MKKLKQLKRVGSMLIAIAMMLSSVPAAKAASEPAKIYISTNGNDQNNGTLTAPFKTFGRALDFIKSNQDKDITVYVRGGSYHLSEPVEFTNDIWNGKNQLLFKSYNNERVVLSGTLPLGRLDWRTYSKNANICVANVGAGLKFDALFANGDKQILARYPNYVNGENLKDIVVTDSEIAKRVAEWQDPEGGYIRALHFDLWGGNDYIITGKNEASLQYKWVGDNNRGGGMSQNRIYENIFEELDAPGEWFYDQNDGNLYFYPPEGLNIYDAFFEGASLERLIGFVGEKM